MTRLPRARFTVECHPLSPARWHDLEALFGSRGACAGCWCMYWRLPAAQWQRQKGEANRQALAALACVEPPPGLLAYRGAEAVGWCAIAPRDTYPRLDRSRVLARVDAKAVWSISCFFVSRPHRGQGVGSALLQAAVDFARDQGARMVEGYPVDPPRPQADVFVYTGLVSMFRRAGFREVARRSPTRPIMRRRLT